MATWKAESGRVASLVVPTRVVNAEGLPVAGARTVAHLVRFTEEGLRETICPFRVTEIETAAETAADGASQVQLRLPVEAPADAVVVVAAMHPTEGTGYAEVTVGELRSGLPTEIQLDPGDAVEGRVTDRDGQPIPGAAVEVRTIGPGDGILLAGLGTRSADDGTFRISGIGLGNELTGVVVYSSSIEVEEDDSVMYLVKDSLYGQKNLRQADYDPETRV